MARPQRPHKCTWDGRLVQGLYKCADGRWRINATGQKFTEPDERRAVQRFDAFAVQRAEKITLTVEVEDVPAAGPVLHRMARQKLRIIPPRHIGDKVTVGHEVSAEEIWPWLREQLIHKPEYVAKMTGIPELLGLRHLPLPKNPIKIASRIEVYQRENTPTDKSKREAIAVFNRLIQYADAKTLDDLTQDKLLSFRQMIEGSGALQSAGTRAGYYGRIKTIISFGLKVGMDQVQLRAALDRCKVLWTAEAMPAVNPQPISKENFHKLLKAAGETTWRAWLLLGLNLCMTAEDLCELRWDDFNLAKGTY